MGLSFSSVTPLYHLYHDYEVCIQDNEVDRFFMNFPSRNKLSQDDCLNSANRPKLFSSRYQQPWSVRSYKFQLGLISTREASSLGCYVPCVTTHYK